MITLYAFGPGFGLPESSPYVTKTEIHLKMAGLPYAKDFGGFPAAPKGKLPYIDDGGVRVADSTFIRAHLERTYGVDFDAVLAPAERARAWAVERMLEDHLAWASAHFRWIDQTNFDKGPAHYFDGAPEPIRATLRADTQAKVAGRLVAVGLGLHAEPDIVWLAGKSLAALARLIGDKPYLMGDRPTGSDAAAFGVAAGLLTPFFDSPLRREAEKHANLRAYVDHMMDVFYPDHAWEGRTDTRPAAQAA